MSNTIKRGYTIVHNGKLYIMPRELLSNKKKPNRKVSSKTMVMREFTNFSKDDYVDFLQFVILYKRSKKIQLYEKLINKPSINK